jgi:hypothetical protein
MTCSTRTWRLLAARPFGRSPRPRGEHVRLDWFVEGFIIFFLVSLPPGTGSTWDFWFTYKPIQTGFNCFRKCWRLFRFNLQPFSVAKTVSTTFRFPAWETVHNDLWVILKKKNNPHPLLFSAQYLFFVNAESVGRPIEKFVRRFRRTSGSDWKTSRTSSGNASVHITIRWRTRKTYDSCMNIVRGYYYYQP